jgi:hypothetical protein
MLFRCFKVAFFLHTCFPAPYVFEFPGLPGVFFPLLWNLLPLLFETMLLLCNSRFYFIKHRGFFS